MRKSKNLIESRDNNLAGQVPGQQEEDQADADSTGTREEIDDEDTGLTQNEDAEHIEEQQLRQSDRTRHSQHLNDYIMSYHTCLNGHIDVSKKCHYDFIYMLV